MERGDHRFFSFMYTNTGNAQHTITDILIGSTYAQPHTVACDSIFYTCNYFLTASVPNKEIQTGLINTFIYMIFIYSFFQSSYHPAMMFLIFVTCRPYSRKFFGK